MKRLAHTYLQIGQTVRIPDHLSAPIVYLDNSCGQTVRIGKIAQFLTRNDVRVTFGTKHWDYSNREALQFIPYFDWEK